jgi:CheY-like chemotaxis protein
VQNCPVRILRGALCLVSVCPILGKSGQFQENGRSAWCALMRTKLSHKIILLADDDLDDAEVFAEILTHVDASVKFYHVKNGLEVFAHMKRMKNQKPAIIFLDINMPEMSGWQCLSVLKNDSLTTDIPVVIYSTSSHHRDKQTAIELGASAFITKPSDYKKLQDLLSVITANLYGDIKAAIGTLL